MSNISICIPYIRPVKFKRASFLASINASPHEIEIVSEEDKERIGAPKMLKRLVDRTHFDYVCFLGDDTLPQPGYLKHAMEAIEDFDDGWGLVGLSDLTGRELPCHWLGHKKMLDKLDGEFFHTGYHHLCSDLELHDRAVELGRYTMCKEAIVRHDHPLINGSEPDKDYQYIYSDPVRMKDRELYLTRKKNGWK